MHKGLEKGKEVYHDAKNSQAAGQILDQGKQVINSPTTHRIEGQVVEEGHKIYSQKQREVHGVVEAGRRGDVNGVIRNGAPLVESTLLKPQVEAARIAKDAAFEILIANAPPEKRGELIRAKAMFDKTSQLLNPSISHLIEGQLKKQATDQALQAASDPNVRHKVVESGKEGASTAGQFFRGVGEKLHIVQPREQAEPQKRQ